MTDPGTLDAAMRAAHARGDGRALIGLYETAARRDASSEAFFLTQAWVHALEAGDPRAPALGERLRTMGRA
ncbi:hypothetical protein [Jannaschia sp. W003]|uniref:hypothetical protein n=1 Tax=Jannaschia sp. W003 TaxID=2867012 RepID=UPI0021A43A1C|nr:hypothetical protein [Jannaschia sp. W003]UWQ20397.1 hypothetical protein K3554_10360 [Jannaschia sp. W003]